jgi:uncharacterized protein
MPHTDRSRNSIRVVEHEIEAAGPHEALRGTLLSPSEGNVPVVLIVPGSGPVDRNGNGPGGLQTSTWRLLAEGLLDRGIASVRIDKRGMYGSASAIPDADDVTIEDYAADIRSWVTTIRRQLNVNAVFVLGHSEGGLAALVAARQMADIGGLLLVSTAGRPVGQILREQLQFNPANAPYLGNAMRILESLESGKRVDVTEIEPALLPLFRPQVQRFLMSELTIDPTALLARYDKPVLIVQGSRDIQVPVEDARLLKQANIRAELALIPDANHVLKAIHSDDLNENIAAYSNPELPLAPGIVDVITAFVENSAAA